MNLYQVKRNWKTNRASVPARFEASNHKEAQKILKKMLDPTMGVTSLEAESSSGASVHAGTATADNYITYANGRKVRP